LSRLRILTVDDEQLALRRLKLLLRTMPSVDHVGEAGGCKDALQCIEQLRPDIVLLDVKMRDGNGFDVLEALAGQPNPPAFVFVTAFDRFAVRAFDSDVVDYLLKPIERDRLSRAVTRVRLRLKAVDAEQRAEELQQVVRALRESPKHDGAPAYESEFWVRGSGGLTRIPVDTIDYVCSADVYISIHTSSAVHLMRGSIRQFEDRVEPGLFVRVHRRWLVKRSAIAELTTPRGGRTEVVLLNGKRIPAGRVHVKSLRRLLRHGWRTDD
jgi:two-component system LytT family response regulator